MQEVVLTVNAGSSTLKIAIFTIHGKEIRDCLYRILLEVLDNKLLFHVNNGKNSYQVDTKPVEDDIMSLMINSFESWWEGIKGDLNLLAIGHRIVHGGRVFTKPILVDQQVIEQLISLIPLDPLHLPYNLQALNLFQEKYNQQNHIVCFDTAFHTSQSRLAKSFALPKEFYEEGVYRYGFHGLSYQWITQNFRKLIGHELPKRTIIGHLGNGASMCAIYEGRSIATSMGFSVIEGLMMGTRCGSIDPGVILYLLDNKKMSPKQIETLLYRQSGLFGVSGESADIRTLLSINDPEAKFAIELFIYRIQLEIGRLCAALQGLDSLVFTAGIGENSAIIRHLIITGLEWLGITIDERKNQENQYCISREDSKVKIFIIPTNEEGVIAQDVIDVLHDK
ncbi:acetate/propionate family kinase [Candidatus Tisiphia endosymbiont of Beris chalybata]|uniref:acetate/propionate family kinase n=1 Tax=Candidatus Tisiphia endosymbiont of Beris chalybata TaxID=3066262 RepID=UPI00312C8D06